VKVLILGAGKMVESIVKGLNADLSDWGIYSPSGQKARVLSQSVGARFVESLDGIGSPEYVILGCKPQQLPEVSYKNPASTYISLLAALSEEHQRSILGVPKLIRVMPNLAVEFKAGVSLISSTSVEDLSFVKELFGKLGVAQIVSDSELEELTVLTGSGPALFYEFTKSLSENFTSLDPKTRESLARQVLIGSGAMVKESEASLAELIDSVTSKKGVTIEVLQKWRQESLKDFISEGINSGKSLTHHK